MASMNWLRRTVRPLQAAVRQTTKRRFAGYPGGTPQSMKAELWGGHSKHAEGWEMDLYVSYGLTSILIIMALAFAPDTSVQAWAQGEAQARLALKAKGFDKFEFGTHYNTTANNEAVWEKFNDRVRENVDVYVVTVLVVVFSSLFLTDMIFFLQAIKPGEDDDDDEDEDEDEDDDE